MINKVGELKNWIRDTDTFLYALGFLLGLMFTDD